MHKVVPARSVPFVFHALRALVVACVVTALGLGLPGFASAAPPKKTATPVITSGPASWVNVSTATLTFTDATAGAKFTCQVDGTAWRACASPFALSALKPGAHTVGVRATAPAMKASGTATRSWNVDLVAPDVPTVTPPANPTGQSTVNLVFASTATDVVGYECAVDGGSWGSCASPFPVTAGVDGPHSAQVRAVDHATNRSAAAAVQWLQDTTTPKPVVNAMPPSVTTATTATFGFSSGELGVTYGCSLDGAAFAACASGLQYTALSTGTHTFAVRATDTVGNTATSDLFSWQVSPAATIVLGWSDPSSLPAAQTNATGGTFAYTASGQTGLACRLDGVGLADCTSPVAVSGLADGVHIFDLVANPGTGTQVVLRQAWTVDTVAPGAPVVTGPHGAVASTSATLTVSPALGGDVLTCALDGIANTCGPTVQLTGLAQGVHSFAATASDAAGNNAVTTVDWTVDTVAPTVVVTAPPQVDQPATVTFGEPVKGAAPGPLAIRTTTGVAVAATVTCRTASLAAVACSAATVRSALVLPARPLVPGEYYQVLVNPAGTTPVTDLAGNAAAPVVKAFRAAVFQQESSRAAVLTWRKVVTTAARGGSYVTEHRAGATASWTFTGTSVSWLTVTGRAFGRATVYVDGVKKLAVNNYSSVTRYGIARTVSGLAAGAHKVTVLVAGLKGSTGGTDTQVAVDGFRVGTVVTVTPALTTAWRHLSTPKAFGGGYSAADLAGQVASLTFRGTGITWYSLRSRASGLVSVYVDGRLKGTYDNYGATAFRVGRTVTGLTNARHTLNLVVLGRHRAGGLGSTVVIDAWIVR